MKSCENYNEMISSYFDDLLDEDQKKSLFSHMKTCTRCNSDFLVYEQIFSEIDNIPDIPLPDDFHDDFMKKLNKEVKQDKKILFIDFKRIAFVAASIAGFIFISSLGNQINNTKDFALTKENVLSGTNSANESIQYGSSDYIAPDPHSMAMPDSGVMANPPISGDMQTDTNGAIETPNAFIASNEPSNDSNYITSYNITLETSDIENLIQYINNYTGITVSSNVQYNDFNNYSNISKQVPLNDVYNFLATIKTYGNVIAESENKQKIQEDLLELQAKKDNENNRKTKLFDYLAQANNIEQITLLEDKINNNQTTFNNYDSQINSIVESANFPIVNITLTSANTTVIQEIPFTTKLIEAFKQSLSNTIYVASSFIILLANNIVVLIVIVIIALIVYTKRRKTNVKK